MQDRKSDLGAPAAKQADRQLKDVTRAEVEVRAWTMVYRTALGSEQLYKTEELVAKEGRTQVGEVVPGLLDAIVQ